VWCARDAVGDEPFAVLLPDDLMDATPSATAQLVDLHEKTGGNVLACEAVAPEDSSRYGIIDPGTASGRATEIKALVEKPAPEDAPSSLGIIGRYVLLPGVFEALAYKETGAGGEIQLTDAMAKMIGAAPFHGLEVKGRRFDCGSKGGFIKAQLGFALKDPDLRPVVLEYLRQEGGEWE
jgi:UTP--glucose-1-phosphate uridylyltransferase